VGTPQPAAIERHPHLAGPVAPGHIRVDMHTHTMFSGDSTTTLDEIVESVIESGIDVLCVTDHNALEGAVRLRTILEEDGICRVIVGEEVKTHTGEIIGLFLSERIPFGETAVRTCEMIRAQGGIVYVPHPFDPMRRNITEDSLVDIASRGLVDAVEVHNSKTSLQSLNAQARRFAGERDLAMGSGSDAHVPHALGETARGPCGRSSLGQGQAVVAAHRAVSVERLDLAELTVLMQPGTRARRGVRSSW